MTWIGWMPYGSEWPFATEIGTMRGWKLRVGLNVKFQLSVFRVLGIR